MLKTPFLFGHLVLAIVAAPLGLAAQSITQLRLGYTNYAPGQAVPIAIGHNATVLVFGPGIGGAKGVNAAGKLNASLVSQAATGVGVNVAVSTEATPGLFAITLLFHTGPSKTFNVQATGVPNVTSAMPAQVTQGLTTRVVLNGATLNNARARCKPVGCSVAFVSNSATSLNVDVTGTTPGPKTIEVYDRDNPLGPFTSTGLQVLGAPSQPPTFVGYYPNYTTAGGSICAPRAQWNLVSGVARYRFAIHFTTQEVYSFITTGTSHEPQLRLRSFASGTPNYFEYRIYAQWQNQGQWVESSTPGIDRFTVTRQGQSAACTQTSWQLVGP